MARSSGAVQRLAFVAAAVLAVARCSSGGQGSGTCDRATPAANGPGDLANVFPATVGSRWFYDVTQKTGSYGGATTRYRVEVTGTRSAGGSTASVFSAVALDGSSTEEALFAKGPGGVVEVAGADVDPALQPLYPDLVLRFPLVPGTSFTQLSCAGLEYGEDLDGDGKNERYDVRSDVTVSGPEAVSLPLGDFEALRVDTSTRVTIHASGGQSATADAFESVWYAPNVGRVRSRSFIGTGGTYTEESEQVLVGYDVEGRRGGLVAVATLAMSVSPAISDTAMPGRTALSFDGAGHLLAFATSTAIAGPTTVAAELIAPDGSPSAPLAVVDRPGSASRPAAAFNGTSHLVVVGVCGVDSTCGTLAAQRVTPAGALLDGASGFDVTSGGPTVYAPAVASDGGGWLVAWSTYGAGLQGARISAAGAVLGTAALRPPGAGASAPGDPAVAFGAGVYLVAWAEGTDVLAVRVQSDGTVLDTAPILVSTGAGTRYVGGVAYGGGSFLVIWGDPRRGDSAGGYTASDVYAARVSPDGTLLDGPAAGGGIAVNALPGASKLDPSVAFDGTGFAVTWWIDGFYGDVGIFGARVAADGVLLDGPASGTGMRVARPVAYASRYVHPVTAPAPGGETLVGWVDNTELSGATKSILGAWYAW
jgi:hypothetical protein